LAKGDTGLLLLDTGPVGIRVQEESAHVSLGLVRVLLGLTALLLGRRGLLFLADVIVVQAIFVGTHDFGYSSV